MAGMQKIIKEQMRIRMGTYDTQARLRCGDCIYFKVFNDGPLKGWGECSHSKMLHYAKSAATFACEYYSQKNLQNKEFIIKKE